jgi:hypothetical protein
MHVIAQGHRITGNVDQRGFRELMNLDRTRTYRKQSIGPHAKVPNAQFNRNKTFPPYLDLWLSLHPSIWVITPLLHV